MFEEAIRLGNIPLRLAGFDNGIEYLNQAIAIDPNYAAAYSELAYNYINQDDWFIDPKEAAPKVRSAAQKALALDEAQSQAHVVLGIESEWYEWDWPAVPIRDGIACDPIHGLFSFTVSWIAVL